MYASERKKSNKIFHVPCTGLSDLQTSLHKISQKQLVLLFLFYIWETWSSVRFKSRPSLMPNLSYCPETLQNHRPERTQSWGASESRCAKRCVKFTSRTWNIGLGIRITTKTTFSMWVSHTHQALGTKRQLEDLGRNYQASRVIWPCAGNYNE